MSIHRIKLIAALCAIAGFAGSTAVRANQDTAKSGSNLHHSANADWSSDKKSEATAASSHASGHSKVMAASEHAEAKRFDELKGKKVTGTNGEELGELHDFIIDAHSGKIAHAVVSSGGMLGIGDKMRVVAHDSLKPGADGLSVQMDKSAFEALPTIDEQDLDAGKVSAKAETSGQDWQQSSTWTGQQGGAATSTDASAKTSSSDIASTNAPDASDDDAVGASASSVSPSSVTDSSATISSPTDTATTPGSTPAATDPESVASTTTQPADVTATTSASADMSASSQSSGNFVRASKLDGKELRSSGGEEIGTIEDVAIDLEKGTAMAVVKMKSDGAGGDDLFHVPFSSIQVDSADAKSVSTSLARTDFVSPTSSQVSAASTTSSSDQSLSPTGRASDSSTGEGYGATASTSTSSSPTPPKDDADAIDAARSDATGASSTYSSSTGAGSTYSNSVSSSSSDPIAASTQTTEPYAATAGPSTSSTTSSTATSDLAGSTTSDNTVSGVSGTSTGTSTSVSTPGSSIGGSTATDASAGIAGPSSSQTTTTEEEQLTPTGRNSVSAHQDLGTAAAAIRSALNSDQTLASEDVRVQEAGKKIMLQGKVSSEDVKERIETLAKQAAGSAEIENKLKVKE